MCWTKTRSLALHLRYKIGNSCLIMISLHNALEKVENATLGLLSTLIRHENEAFWKCSSDLRPVFRLRVDENHFENGAFWKRWRHDYHVIFLTEFSWNINTKWSPIVAFSISSDVLWTEDIWCVSKVKPLLLNLPGVVRTELSLGLDEY